MVYIADDIDYQCRKHNSSILYYGGSDLID